jgi:hypothetical protein
MEAASIEVDEKVQQNSRCTEQSLYGTLQPGKEGST